jgi:hypothetical protein
MRNLSNDELLKATGGESFGSVVRAAASGPSTTVGNAYQSTVDFIGAHPFFHEGVMNLPIGGGKHFRNVPFVGPGEVGAGLLSGNANLVAKGAEVTRGTWAAK